MERQFCHQTFTGKSKLGKKASIPFKIISYHFLIMFPQISNSMVMTSHSDSGKSHNNTSRWIADPSLPNKGYYGNCLNALPFICKRSLFQFSRDLICKNHKVSSVEEVARIYEATMPNPQWNFALVVIFGNLMEHYFKDEHTFIYEDRDEPMLRYTGHVKYSYIESPPLYIAARAGYHVCSELSGNSIQDH